MATTIAQTTIATCKAQGYNVSVHVLGREGQTILVVRNPDAGLATFENSMKKGLYRAHVWQDIRRICRRGQRQSERRCAVPDQHHPGAGRAAGQGRQ